ncbi:MAG: glycosyltransferase family 39 protein [Planctomycetota bacterium]
MSPKKICFLLVLAIILGAFVIRLSGINDRGFPFSYYDDETANLKRAVRFYNPATGLELNPHWFNKPALGYYVNFGEFGFYYLYGHHVSGEFENPSDFAAAFFRDRGTFYYIARFYNCISAALTVWVLFALASRLYGRRTGLLAAFILAILPGHVIWSQMVKHDILATLFATLSMACLLKAHDQGRLRHWILAGAFAGFGAATKYVPIFMAVPIACLWAFGPRPRLTKQAILKPFAAAIALVGAFFIGSPYNFLDGQWLRNNLGPQFDFAQQLLFGAGDVDPSQDNWFSQLNRFYAVLDNASCLGLAMIVLALVGAVVALRSSARGGTALMLAMIVMSVFAVTAINEQFPQENHLVILYPLAAVLAARGIAALIGFIPQPWRDRPLTWFAAAALLLTPIFGLPGHGLLLEYQALQRPVTKLAAYHWIEANIPSGETIVIDHGIVHLDYSDSRLDWADQRVQHALKESRARIKVLETRPSDKTAEELKYHVERANRYSQYQLEWEFARAAEAQGKRPRYDAIVVQHVWQTNIKEEIESKIFGYNDLWASRALSLPADLAPVERYRALRSKLPDSMTVAQKRDHPVLDQPVNYWVTARKSYDNYVTEQKVESFPEYTAFYRDLHAHYDCWEFPGTHGDQGLDTVRIYDLRRRVERPKVTKIDPADWMTAQLGAR